MGNNNDTPYDEAAFDDITGLPTMAILKEHFDFLINSASIGQANLIPVLMLKLNHAKASVPELDLLESEQLLKTLGCRLTSCEITGISGVATLNPTLFALVLLKPEYDDSPGFISQQANQVLSTVTYPFNLANDKKVTIAASLGVACYPCDGNTLETLLENALTASYQAHSEGENCYQFYTKY